MRKSLSAVVAVTVLILPTQSSQAANPKIGTTCNKLNLKQTYAGKSYICIRSGKKLVWDKKEPISSSENSANTSNSKTTSTTSEQKIAYLSSPEPLDTCRVPDARTKKNVVTEAIAYPVNHSGTHQTIPNKGHVKVAIIPIDFPDVAGNGTPAQIIEPIIEQSNKWLKQFSNGKTTYDFQTTNRWIRAGKNSNFYIWKHPGHPDNPLPDAIPGPDRSATEIATELMGYAQNDFDYKNLNIVFFIYPKNIVNIYDAMTQFTGIETNVGTVQIQVNATGAWSYLPQNAPLWSWFIHENMHPTGIAGHAPNDGSPFSVMTNQSGGSLVLNSWDQAILDWQAENEIYCISQENIFPIEIPINSIDNEQLSGTKAIFVRLNSHEVLVIESRRNAYWSSGFDGSNSFPPNFSGLLIYKVDTSIDVNRVSDSGGFAQLQLLPGIQSGRDYSPQNLYNFLIKKGQTLNVSGVSVTLSKSGIYDTVLLKKT